LPEVPPPGPLLVTEKFRAPVVAAAVTMRFAVKLVKLFTVVELTVMPSPTFTEVTPAIKFVPVKTTSSVCRRLPLIGEMLVKVGLGLLPTVKPFAKTVDPPPGAVLVTETFRGPSAALAPMVIFAVICVALLTIVESTVMSAPKFTELTPLIKFVPVRTTASVCKRPPLVGEMLVKVGTGFPPTVKPFAKVAVPPPGAALVTETFRGPSAALMPMVIVAPIWIGLLTDIESTVMSAPKFSELTPLIKFVPKKTTSSVCPRLPLAGLPVKVGTGLFTVKV